MVYFELIEGGCVCGVICYCIVVVLIDVGFCYCWFCQCMIGVVVVVLVMVLIDVFEYLQGELIVYVLSVWGEWCFCGCCGV